MNDKKKPDWNDAPEWANWLAMDSNGLWCWYKNKPYASLGSFFSVGRSTASKSSVLSNWKESLEQRPEQENLEFEVVEVSSTVENNHGFLKLKLPYGYSKIEGILSKGDKVTVSFTIPF